jgi:hypothetical protein
MTQHFQPNKSWKGVPQFGTHSNHLRPFTNNDQANNFNVGFGLARPIKHYRKGRVMVVPEKQQVISANERNNMGIPNMLDKPGSSQITSYKENEPGTYTICTDCNLNSTQVTSNYFANPSFLTNNPTKLNTNPTFCCNAEQKAKKRMRAPITLVSKNYYTTLSQYKESRCQSYKSKQFNFNTLEPNNDNAYLANCRCKTSDTCRRVIYKPNNSNYAVEGSVDSSLRTFSIKNKATVSNSRQVSFKQKMSTPCTVNRNKHHRCLPF